MDLVAATPGLIPRRTVIAMSSRSLLNVAMLLATVLGALFVYTYKPDADAPSAQALVPVEPSEIRSVQIERVNSPTIVLQRNGSQWRMSAPVSARLDETALARVLDLSRLGATNKLAADDPAKYGLDQPWARVRFGDHSLEFGNTNTVTEELYVRSASAIHAVPARNTSAIPATPGKLIAHRMLAEDETIAAVTFAGGLLRHDGTRWQLDPPDPGLSQDDLIRWVEQWRYASSVITQPGAPAATKDIVIELRDGRRIDIGVKSRAPALVLHRHDEGLDYHFNARMDALLLSSPSTAANQAR